MIEMTETDRPFINPCLSAVAELFMKSMRGQNAVLMRSWIRNATEHSTHHSNFVLN